MTETDDRPGKVMVSIEKVARVKAAESWLHKKEMSWKAAQCELCIYGWKITPDKSMQENIIHT